MFYIENEGSSVVYTGDFNSSADRHLGAAWIEKLFPDLLISKIHRFKTKVKVHMLQHFVNLKDKEKEIFFNKFSKLLIKEEKF